MRRRFAVVDVFSDEPYRGNPVAVVLDGDGIDEETMQQVANWTNLSETTFVLPPTEPGADYQVRIFTGTGELPFAGHPTLGTCHAWSNAEVRVDTRQFVQQCPGGLVRIRREPTGLAFAAPPLVRSGAVDADTVDRVADQLRLERSAVVDAAWVDNGPGWMALLLPDADRVLAVDPGPVDASVGIVGPYPPGTPLAYEVRAFTPALGTGVEDPVTGSLNASLAQWLLDTGRVRAPYTAGQGTALGRRGRVHIAVDDGGSVWVGGATVTCVAGTIDI